MPGFRLMKKIALIISPPSPAAYSAPRKNATKRKSPAGFRHHRIDSRLGGAVTEQAASHVAGFVAMLHRHLPVDEDVAVTLRLLDATPFAAREIMRKLNRSHRKLVVVVDHDVGGRAFAQRAAIAEARA